MKHLIRALMWLVKMIGLELIRILLKHALRGDHAD